MWGNLRLRRGQVLLAPLAAIVLGLSGLPNGLSPAAVAAAPASTASARPVTVATDTAASRCNGAVFQFPLRGATLGWMFGDPRSAWWPAAAADRDPSVIHSGIDLWPGTDQDVYAFGDGTITAVGTHSMSIYYPALGGVMTYITHIHFTKTWHIKDAVASATILGTVDQGYGHIHFSVRRTQSGYNDQFVLAASDGTYLRDKTEGGTRTNGGQDPSSLFNARLAIPMDQRNVVAANGKYADRLTGNGTSEGYPKLATSFCNSSAPINTSAGSSITITKSVLTSRIPAIPDVVFLADTTGSMSGAIYNVASNATSVMSQVLAQQPAAWFGAAEYKDFDCDASPYVLDQGLTSNTGGVQSAIDSYWYANGGCDTPESQLNALYMLATDASVGWRSGSTRIVAWFGDSPGHDPSNGHGLNDVIAALRAAKIRVVAVNVSDLDGCADPGMPCGQATAIAKATGGSVLTLGTASMALEAAIAGDNGKSQTSPNSSIPLASPGDVASTILEGLSTLPTTITPSASCGAGVDVSFEPPTQTVTSGATASFQVKISTAGTIDASALSACAVEFVADGQTIVDPAVAEPIVIYPPIPPASIDIAAKSTYHAITPTRILDTRYGVGGLSGPFTNHKARSFTVTGTVVPATATAVTGNLTVTGQTSGGYLFIGPVATNYPTSSTLNFPVGDDRANAVTVALSGAGSLSITFVGPRDGPSAQAIFDVTGYFSPDASGATYHAISPGRVLDTRNGTGGLSGPFTNHAARTFTVTGIPAGATAVTGNLTVTGQTSNGYFFVSPVATNTPGSSTLNFPVGDDRANAVTVALGTGNTLSITFVAPRDGQSAQAIFDVTGYFTADMTGSVYVPLDPARRLDTRFGTGGLSGPFTNHAARTFGVSGGSGNVPADAIAVTGNLTVTGQTSNGYLFISPAATNNPGSSTLNFPVRDDRANAITVGLGAGSLSITFVAPMDGPSAHAILDVTGYFVPGLS